MLLFEYFSHPQHQLVLKEDVIGVDATCHVCDKPVIGSPAYTCSSDDIGCKFYLHKSCAELPKEIIRDKLDLHPLALLPRPRNSPCDFCSSVLNFAYACVDCNFDLCVVCVLNSSMSDQRVIRHKSHKEHTLTLQRQALFKCDACWEEAKDYSYVCFTCDFWIHKKCAFSPLIIPAPTYHHHPLNLVFSIPVMFRYFSRYCAICKKRVQSMCWSYFCHKCTFFVHMKCSTSTVSLVNEIEAEDIGNYPDLVVFPLPTEESLFELIITRCSKFQVKFQADGENCTSMLDDPYIIKEHWSHRDHPLEMQQFTFSENELHDDDNDNYDDSRVLICDGCIQPITFSHVSYYACIQCRFFLHTFCATKLTAQLPVGACSFHPHHLLKLDQYCQFYDFFCCAVCGYNSNGFFYECEICDIKIEIRCAFSASNLTIDRGVPDDPYIIKEHWSHKDHPLEMQQFTFSENELHDDDNDNYDDRRVLICDGCIQPITVSCPSYYACMQCQFFLHSFCATKLPKELPVGACSFHPHHSLKLCKNRRFYDFFFCALCGYRANGFYYKCEICDIRIEIRCAFLPTRIRHKSHKKHSLVQRPFSRSLCCATNFRIYQGVEYACETCSTFQIYILNAFYPSTLKHRYDDHPLSLKHPPFFYEGVFYCEICEDQVNNQWWLYHCDKCDYSFHCHCIRMYLNIKVGGTIKCSIGNQQYTLTLILKVNPKKKSSPYFCVICGEGYKGEFFFECEGCGYLACIFCIRTLEENMGNKECEIFPR